MIFDRTQNDVDTAIVLRREKVQKFQELSDSEIATLEKGLLTINTLNRIEDKQEELKNLFNEMKYMVIGVQNRRWEYTDLFRKEDFERILKNNEILKESFFVYSSTPKEQDENFTKFQSINIVEKILHDLDVMINDIKSHYKVCGDTICGE